MKPYTTKLRCFYFWRPETGSAGDFTHSLPGSCAIKFNMAGNVQFLDLTPSKRTLTVVDVVRIVSTKQSNSVASESPSNSFSTVLNKILD